MFDLFGGINNANQQIASLVAKKDAEAKAEELKKEKEALQTKLDTLESSITKLQDKAVAQTNTPAPAPVKSMTLIHVGLLAGGLVLGYFITKMVSK